MVYDDREPYADQPDGRPSLVAEEKSSRLVDDFFQSKNKGRDSSQIQRRARAGNRVQRYRMPLPPSIKTNP